MAFNAVGSLKSDGKETVSRLNFGTQFIEGDVDFLASEGITFEVIPEQRKVIITSKISDWKSNTEYKSGNIVSYTNALWRCKVDHTSSLVFNLDMSVGNEKWERQSMALASGGYKQIQKNDKLTGYEFLYTIENPKGDYLAPPIEVLKFDTASLNQLMDIHNFNNAESTDFLPNSNIVFDGLMKLNTTTNQTMTNIGALGTGILYESSVIDIDDYKAIESIEVVDNDQIMNLNITTIPYGQLIMPTGSVSILSVDRIDNVTITATTSGNAVLKIIASVDGRQTWNTWDGSQWANLGAIDTNSNANKLEVKTQGMTVATVNSLTNTQWDLLYNYNPEQIAFAYYMEVDSSTDVCANDKVSLQVDMRGSYIKAQHITHYQYSYVDPYTIKFTINANGTYKFNIAE